MQKLTAGIFAAILVTVASGAANAAVTSKAYVDNAVAAVEEQVGTLSALDTAVKTNTVAAINELKGAVDTNADDIAELQGILSDAGITGDDSLSDLLDAKQDVLTQADFTDGNGVSVTVSDAGIDISGVDATQTAAGVVSLGQIDSAIDTKIDTALDEDGVIADAIADAVDGLASESWVEAKGYLTETDKNELQGNIDEKADADALNAYQLLLGTTNVTTTGEGNVVTSVTAANGTVTVTKGDTFVTTDALEDAIGEESDLMAAIQAAQDTADDAADAADAAQSTADTAKTTAEAAIPKPTAACDADGGCVLTYKGGNYVWEVIERFDGE